MRYILVSVLLFVLNVHHAQKEISYAHLYEKGKENVEDYGDVISDINYHLKLQEAEDPILLFYNSDTTKMVIVTEHISNYDPTNNIREDDHNKVNFITFGSFDERKNKKHSYRTFSFIYYKLEDEPARWYEHSTEFIDYYPDDKENVRLNYLSRVFTGLMIDNEDNSPSKLYWDNGLFAQTPDLKKDPNWEAFGKNVWKRKEKLWRPYIGVPVLVREALMKSNTN